MFVPVDEPRRITRRIDTAALGFTDDLIGLGELAQRPSVDSAVAAVRELLGMELAFSSQFVDGHQVVEVLRGDAESFGVREGVALPLDQTYCHRVLAGRLPSLIPDVRADGRAASLPITEAADFGAFASVPLTFSDGRCYGTLCAGSHQPKPSLGYRDLQFLHVFARIVADQLERDELAKRAQELEQVAHGMELQAAAASALIAALRTRDAYTGDHSRAVVDRVVAVARHLGLSENDVTDVKHVALLHDIGKLSVPDAILMKDGPLTDEEWEIMRRHPIYSESMISDVPGLRHLAPMVRAEHERWDGKGYPDGLAGEAIPLASRITFVCDAYHAMTSDRPYRRALSGDAARAEISANLGTQFCPTAGGALLAVVNHEH
jgi:HD domain/GAF domain